MNQLPKKLEAPERCGWNEESPHFKINEIIDYLESQKGKEGECRCEAHDYLHTKRVECKEEPKHIDVEGLLREYANLVIKNQDMPVTNRELEIINTLKALQQ